MTMSDRTSFLRAIHDNPNDVPLRLVFADWLEEHDDPLAEFIRVQVELEPIRFVCGNPRAETLREREEKLLGKYRESWLGEAASLDEPRRIYPDIVRFRNGLPESVLIRAASLVEHASALRRCCPTMHKLILMEVRGNAGLVAKCEGLRDFQWVEVADWISPADAQLLSANPHLCEARTLTVWLGSRHQKRVCQILVERLPGLRRVELFQLHGGINARKQARAVNKRADELAATLKALRARLDVVVVRPFERLFNLKEFVWTALYAGRLPQNRACLAFIYSNPMIVATFNEHGELQGEIKVPVHESLVEKAGIERQAYDNLLLEHLKEATGFQPGVIRVKEFISESWLTVHLHGGPSSEYVEHPDVIPDSHTEEDRLYAPRALLDWIEGGNYVVSSGGENYWADWRGGVHTT
jgi:uncharacterized protein (TIGR02996 family)